MSIPLRLTEIAGLCGKKIAPFGKRGFCPVREHKRDDKTFATFISKDSGAQLYKCWSCDPPNNVGDAVGLYAVLSGMTRSDAWKQLKEKGYDVPGQREDGVRRSNPPPRKAVTPIEGSKPRSDAVLKLDLKKWHEWKGQRLGAVERFAADRHLDAETLRGYDVVDINSNAVGFGYRNPDTDLPCRVKIRAIDKKSFWIEPKAKEGEQGTALGPLYLAHAIRYEPSGLGTVMVVTEGEVDALTLRAAGIRNAVSLPDGSSSAARVDLTPIWTGCSLVLSATDADEEGERAHRALYARTSSMHIAIGRVYWQQDGSKRYKDANDALKAGFTRGQFLACLQRAADETMGYAVTLESAC